MSGEDGDGASERDGVRRRKKKKEKSCSGETGTYLCTDNVTLLLLCGNIVWASLEEEGKFRDTY